MPSRPVPDHLLVFLERDLFKTAQRPCSCVVDPYIDAPELRNRGFTQLFDIRAVAYVGRNCQRASTCRFALADKLFQKLLSAR